MAPPLKTCRWASQELISSVHDIPGLSSATSDRLTQYAWLVSALNVRRFRQFRPKSMAKSLKIPLKSMKIRCWMIICIHLSYENLTFGYFWHQTWYHILATAVFSGYLLFVAVTHGNATLGLDWSLLTYLGFTGCQIETQKPVNESSLVCHQTATIRITKSKVQDWASRRNLKSKASRCKHLETQGFLSTHIQYIQDMLSSQDSSSGRFGLDKRLVFEVSVACLY